jgi:hypothetical protein
MSKSGDRRDRPGEDRSERSVDKWLRLRCRCGTVMVMVMVVKPLCGDIDRLVNELLATPATAREVA